MAHDAALSQLQHPAHAVVSGRLVPYDDVVLHAGMEAVSRAVSVVEGLKGYWDPDGETFAVRTPREHYERLCHSASVMRMPVDFGYDEFVEWLTMLARELLVDGKDLWWKTSLFVTEGHWGVGTKTDLVITAFTQRQQSAAPMALTVSTWRRASDVVLPPRVKSGANYVMARVARIDANRVDRDDAIMLNEHGRVAEATTSCVVIVDRHGLVTPPSTEGCLDSITIDTLEAVCAEKGIGFARRPIDRTELLTAKECGLAGTVAELTLVRDIDGFEYRQDGLLADLQEDYLQVMRRVEKAQGVEMATLAVR